VFVGITVLDFMYNYTPVRQARFSDRRTAGQSLELDYATFLEPEHGSSGHCLCNLVVPVYCVWSVLLEQVVV